ncbi:MMPL family transporter [Wenzhouxiangella sp. XN79A]|uniref:efflux RND transporter permease subunit n=1 Tax=Wenzhouxiangella sp. XN79A TaxID=2724193 RepID=UPI00144ACB35|nr:efflux RND transporter permease subunit [Wenzhouxiangella sp. XN79A]NKI33732.1 MMPL family transporter [Wenzhouxiangella sp. XN79A]
MSRPALIDRLADRTTTLATGRPGAITLLMVASLVLLAAVAALPSIWPQTFSALHPATIDTDPENMLAHDEPVRVFHDEAKDEFNLYDLVVIGIVNESHPDGVFNPDSLARIDALTEFVQGLSDPKAEPGEYRGVVAVDVIAPGTVDDIRQDGPGQVAFSWLMETPPVTAEAAREIRERAMRIPMLRDTMVAGDGSALAIYVPLTHKDFSWNVREAVQEFTADWPADDQVHITGLPVAEDTFGVEMFYQMAVSAPLAMLVIFILMWWFFRNLVLVISPMIVAMVSSLSTMALLIATGNTIHIMSSMIPIFVMPIAVLDSVHILSEAFDTYRKFNDRRKTIEHVMKSLFRPMLFTSLTTTAGFLSLALTPIPPVQVFGVFVAVGVLLAWLWSILFVPAFFMMIPEKRLAAFGHDEGDDAGSRTLLGRTLHATGRGAMRGRVAVLFGAVALVSIAAFGITQIRINDNPIKWFDADHPIRVADRVLNAHFAGTYTAYLELHDTSTGSLETLSAEVASALGDEAEALADRGLAERAAIFEQAAERAGSVDADDAATYFSELQDAIQSSADASDDPFTWDDAWLVVDAQRSRLETFKQPEILEWMIELQNGLLEDPRVGKVNGLPDIVRVVHRELLGGGEDEFRIPDRAATVAQTLMTYQNSHRPQDLWRFVTPDYRKTSLWIQMTSGDNQDMEQVISTLDAFLAENPPPVGIEADWFGLTYINVVWQEKMVNGMLWSFMGSFLVVLTMMTLLFRSFLWGLLAMVPLTITVALIYGVIGLIGKDYDMPVAVLSSLSLGLAVDFAIHFLTRARQVYRHNRSWTETAREVFGEPARAISRNVIILGAGFLPLLAAPLVPYQTVGIFIASIIFAAGIITLVLLPALITTLEKPLFRRLAKEA